MALRLFAHPFSSYSQKVLIALYENALPFELCLLSPENEVLGQEFARRWPLQRFPFLVDGEQQVAEASIIIEYLQQRHPGPVKLIPDGDSALDVRFMDRFFDNYISTPQQSVVFNALREPHLQDPLATSNAQAVLDTAYRWLNEKMADQQWAAGDAFSLADCGAAPFLFYAHWTYPINEALENLLAYRQRLLARPSFARAVEEARPYRDFFPLPVQQME